MREDTGAPSRDGDTFVEERDGERLARQHRDVLRVMSDNMWRTLDELERETGHPQASISARLRDLRKPQHGSRAVSKTHMGRGVWIYRLEPEVRK